MSKHTPAPWHCHEKYGLIVFADTPHIGAMVADIQQEFDNEADHIRMRGVGCKRTDEEMQANCRLIAASPDMKTALQCYDQPVRTAINMLRRQGGAAAQVADELRAALCIACDALEKAGQPNWTKDADAALTARAKQGAIQADENEALMFAAVNAIVEAAAITGIDPMEYAKNLPQWEHWNQQNILIATGATDALRRMQEENDYKNQQRAEHGDGNV